ncbi:MAG TPA: cellulose synthase subunit BcsC-related outer membrane protein [Terracidiphilus sp.]|nr:cellulose synthase subunit BcsC-related outer membrane protein [Terracidiphilus sp.]
MARRTGLMLLLALASLHAQTPPAAGNVRAILVTKAKALEARGRPDMAIELWQQVLLSDPDNADALAGLARDYRLTGSIAKSNEALNHLRRVSPNNPEIDKIEGLSSTRATNDQLRHAGELAQQGHRDEAMRVYRQLYGDHPPDGDIALAYYQTLYGTGTPEAKQQAIAAMRAMAQRNPGDTRFAIELGVMLTYDPGTRTEGMHILEMHPHDAHAQAALRQALIWNAANPASAADLRAYLHDHPGDTELAGYLKDNESKLVQMSAARSPLEGQAYAALNAHKLDEAEKEFTELLAKEPKNGRAAAGLGYVHMQEKDFPSAVMDFEQAEDDGYKTKAIDDALTTSRFWTAMGEASKAFDANQLNDAQAKYQEALVLNPHSADALNGLAGLLVREQRYGDAAGVYNQLVQVEPESFDGWRGLFLAYAQNHQNGDALGVVGSVPSDVKAALEMDPTYLRTLAGIYQSLNRDADAQRVLTLGLALPFPENGAGLTTETKLEYASILTMARRYDQAATLYSQIVSAEPANLQAWTGLVNARHQAGQDAQAIADVEKMPPDAYQTALNDADFLALLAAIYQQSNQLDVAQGLLERAEKAQMAAGKKPSEPLELQLAAIDLQRGNTAQAYDIYRRNLAANPASGDAWKGLISALLATNRNSEALQEIGLIPAATRKQLENDIAFEQSVASAYAVNGDTTHAMEYMNRVQAYYAKLNETPPASVAIQNAWLLYNTGNDRALYPALMQLGGRSDLTLAQRETVQEIWANWSVRRAGTAMDEGDAQRAADILDAAFLAFPNNMTVRKAVAGGYVRVGRAKEALAIFKALPMDGASATDYEGAINAALAANDRIQTEAWLRQALASYPHDAAILTLAARFEQARGDNARAADYYRASLAAMPPATPVDRLAHALDYPEQDVKPHRAITAADLQKLLDPANEPFAKTTKLPPLPAYGPDPLNGKAPVTPTPESQPAQPATEEQTPPPHTSGPSAELQPMRGVYGDGVLHVSMRDGQAHVVLASFTRTLLHARMPQAGSADASAAQPMTLSLHPPHSMASDNWKGLVTSLFAAGRRDEALTELGKAPLDVRRLLESDLEFVQTLASLYAASGDHATADFYAKRVEEFYSSHRDTMPANVELGHTWMLYNVRDETRLYPVLMHVDQRGDLSAEERGQVSSLWASWAVRRAGQAMDAGNMQRGVQILLAAYKDYPGNASVRRATVDALVRAGRGQDALAIIHGISFENATPDDFVSAVAAAMAAGDRAQASAWLRQALGRYPSDAKVLSEAARYEQVCGNAGRAADYWRAALAVLPPGETVKNPPTPMAYAQPVLPEPAPGETKRLLDPRLDAQLDAQQGSQPSPGELAPLPSYRSLAASRQSEPVPLPVLPMTAVAEGDDLPPPPGYAAAPVGAQPRDTGQKDQGSSVHIHVLPNAVDEQQNVAQNAPPTQPAAQQLSPAKKAHTAMQTESSAPAPQSATPAPAAAPAQTLGNMPALNTQPMSTPAATAPAPPPVETQAQTAPASNGRGLSDEQLEQQNLPPLRGPWVRVQRQSAPPNPREQVEMQLRAIESGYSGWMGGTGYLNYRSGALGYDHLSALESPFEASAPLGAQARITVVAKPVFLDSGQADGTATINVVESSTSRSCLIAIPEPIGTYTNTSASIPNTGTCSTSGTATGAPPSQQNATGVGGELQLAFPNFAIAAGYTPYGFLVSTITGRMQWRPENGPLTLNFVRDSEKDSQLSYAGLRDPAGNTLSTQGQIWGGVVYDQGNIQFGRGDASSGYYFGVGGQYLSGYHVETNMRVDGVAGSYWRLYSSPENGTLTIGANFFAMHYAHNEGAFTHGMGGYFSPQAYFLANVPFAFTGHYLTKWHYNVNGGLGVQAFQENSTPLWPLAVDKALEISQGSPKLPGLTSVGPNYDLHGQAAYQISPHWFAGGYFAANNTRNYQAASAGFFVRYVFREQPSTAAGPTGLFPADGLRPFSVP